MGDRLGFARAVEQSIGPLLLPMGFARTSSTPTLVRYASPGLTVEVCHELFSYEMTIIILRGDRESDDITLADIVQALPGREGRRPPFFQASEAGAVRRNAEVMTALLREHGGAILSGDAEAFEAVRSSRARLATIHTKQVVQAPIREAAERAWKSGDYAAVRTHYASIAADLTPLERRRWEYAEDR